MNYKKDLFTKNITSHITEPIIWYNISLILITENSYIRRLYWRILWGFPMAFSLGFAFHKTCPGLVIGGSVKLYRDGLAFPKDMYFPWKSIWKSKIPSRVAFFSWTIALGNLLLLTTCVRGSSGFWISFICANVTRKRGSLITSLSYCYGDVVYGIWFVQSVLIMPKTVVDLLASWLWRFGCHRYGIVWKLFLTIWCVVFRGSKMPKILKILNEIY